MKRSKFDLSHYKLLTCDMGELVPVMHQEVLPGDTFQQATSLLVRVSPLLAPVMHPVHVRIHHWFVPYRLLWDSWEDFITGGPDGLNASVFPTVNYNYGQGSLSDYLGLPSIGAAYQVSALPFRAYSLIFNEWYRDQDLQTELTVNKGSGNDGTTNVTMQNVCWEKDYFTSARPWPQKGPQVMVPLGDSAPVISTNAEPYFTTSGGSTPRRLVGTNGATTVAAEANWTAGGQLRFSNAFPTGLEADLANASGVSVDDFRTAMALQRYQEFRARFGSRYSEYLRGLGVKSSDARLQRPEYLGGGRQTIQFSEVLQTGTNFDANTGVATLRGHGIGAVRSNRYRRFFEEHGIVMTLMSVKPKTMYTQGVARHWNRRIKEDFFQRELQHIGQQEILNKEIYAAHADPNGVFGYQDRYDEYRRFESSVAGEFRSTLDYWHMARVFASTPALNSSFVSSVPTKRVLASQSTDALWIMANHSVQARRIVSQSAKSFIF